MNDFRLLVAPLQGFTEAPFRHFHAALYGHDKCSATPLTYFSPFIRVEKGELRAKDIRDIASPLDVNHHLIPQAICRDRNEFAKIADAVIAAGYNALDLNLGCPFTPQVRKGRGAGLLEHPDSLKEIASAMTNDYPGLSFSIKMRLGVVNPDEWQQVLPIIESMPLTHLTIHPRTASQQYSGELRLSEFASLASATHHPVIFNGDLRSMADIAHIRETLPSLAGVMVGRGLLMRPSLLREYLDGHEWSLQERHEMLLRLHSSILDHFTAVLHGETQILSKIKPLWEYFSNDFDRKTVKKILKATRLQAYLDAISTLS